MLTLMMKFVKSFFSLNLPQFLQLLQHQSMVNARSTFEWKSSSKEEHGNSNKFRNLSSELSVFVPMSVTLHRWDYQKMHFRNREKNWAIVRIYVNVVYFKSYCAMMYTPYCVSYTQSAIMSSHLRYSHFNNQLMTPDQINLNDRVIVTSSILKLA